MTEWISVAERLPSTADDVLVFGLANELILGAETGYGVGSYVGPKMGWQLSNTSGEKVDWLITKVTHWMALPSPPEPPK